PTERPHSPDDERRDRFVFGFNEKPPVRALILGNFDEPVSQVKLPPARSGASIARPCEVDRGSFSTGKLPGVSSRRSGGEALRNVSRSSENQSAHGLGTSRRAGFVHVERSHRMKRPCRQTG